MLLGLCNANLFFRAFFLAPVLPGFVWKPLVRLRPASEVFEAQLSGLPLCTKESQGSKSPKISRSADISAVTTLLEFPTQVSSWMNTPGAWRLVFVGPEPKLCREHSTRNSSTKPLTVEETDAEHRPLKDWQRTSPSSLARPIRSVLSCTELGSFSCFSVSLRVWLLTQLRKPNKSFQYYKSLGAEIKLELIICIWVFNNTEAKMNLSYLSC